MELFEYFSCQNLLIRWRQIDIVFYMQERADLSSADWAFVGLHPDNLGAVDTEAHVSARKHHRILRCGVAHNAFFLTFIGEVGRHVVYSINVIQIHYLGVIKQLLFQELVSVDTVISSHGPVGVLDVFAAFSFVPWRINSFYGDDYWVKELRVVD